MNQSINNPHDKLFKETWSDIKTAKDYFCNYLPQPILNIINLNTLELQKDSFVDEKLREFFSDMLYSVSFDSRKGDRKKGYIYVLFEHKSSFDKQTPLQLLEYMVMIWRLYLKQFSFPLPVIIPLVLYHGIDKWSIGTKFSGLFDNPYQEITPYIPNFSYSLLDLSKYTDDEIRGEVLSKAVLLLFKHVSKPDFEEKLPEIFNIIGSIIKDETPFRAIETLLRYVFSNTDQPLEKIKKILYNSLSKGKEDITMNLAERLINEGMERGMERGRYQGFQQGIVDILNIRFNSIPEYIMKQLNQINDIEKLRAINKKAVMINSISELVEYLN